MKQTHIILIGILILGIFLFAILGEKLWREGMQGTFSGTFNVNNPNGPPHPPPPSGTSGTSGTSGSSTPSSVQYDNYNHFTQSSTQLPSGTTFYGANGGNVYVTTNSDGTQTLTVTLATGQTPLIFTSTQSGYSTSSTTNSSSMAEGYTNYSNSNTGTATTFSGPMGDTATILTTANGQKAVNVQTSEGAYTFGSSGSIYNPNNTSNTGLNSTQYYGSTGSPIQTGDTALAYQGPYGGSGVAVSGQNNTAYYAEGPQGNSVSGVYPNNNTNDVNAGAVTGPQGNTAFYASGQNGTVAGVTTNSSNNYNYSNELPPGIPKSQIPAGSEDLYILKSQVVPPVCPMCPQCVSSSNAADKSCPPCPAPSRCKYPPVTCKAVPDYNNIEDQYLPSPVLNDFSQFGL